MRTYGGCRLCVRLDGRGARNVATGKLLGQPLRELERAGSSMAFSRDGKILAAPGGLAGRLWDVTTRQPVGKSLQVYGGVTCVAFSPDGKTVVGGVVSDYLEGVVVWMWNVATGRMIKTLVGAPILPT